MVCQIESHVHRNEELINRNRLDRVFAFATTENQDLEKVDVDLLPLNSSQNFQYARRNNYRLLSLSITPRRSVRRNLSF